MKFLEKYKIYRKILKQIPYDIEVSSEQCTDCANNLSFMYDDITYKVKDYKIKIYCDNYVMTQNTFKILRLNEWPVQYRAYVYPNPDATTYFCLYSLMAKRLFNHGKKYSK